MIVGRISEPGSDITELDTIPNNKRDKGGNYA